MLFIHITTINLLLPTPIYNFIFLFQKNEVNNASFVKLLWNINIMLQHMVSASHRALNLVKLHIRSSITFTECLLIILLELSKSVIILPYANDFTFSIHWLRRDTWMDGFSDAWFCSSTITQGFVAHMLEISWNLDCSNT